MIHMLTYDNDEDELKGMESIIRNQAAMETDDVWNIETASSRKQYLACVEDADYIDSACIDITGTDGISDAELTRNKFKDAYIILLADMSISPVKYMRPTIKASSLMLRPLQQDMMKQTFSEMMQTMHTDDSEGNVFVVDDEDGRNRIPYGNILYFESRDKKIYVCTVNEQYGFYDTIERLMTVLPDDFVRCHRSFIVNINHIVKTAVSESTVYLEDDYSVPLSRSYKEAMKKYKYGKE